MASTSTVRLAICTSSLGKSQVGHTIETKLNAAKRHGFEGVEVAMECLECHAESPAFASLGSRADRLKAAAKDIGEMASDLSLEIIALNPLGALDGLADAGDFKERLVEADLWLQLTDLLNTPILQTTSAVYPLQKALTSDPKRIADNLRTLCQMAQKYDKLVAYEAISWGINTNTWEQARDVLHLVDMPNIRYCLDTFHIAAKVAGDPFNQERPLNPAGLQELTGSLDELRRSIKPSEIGYFQLSDAAVADIRQRGYPSTDFDAPPFMVQSRNCRLFPCEPQHGGILPVAEVANAVFIQRLGFHGGVPCRPLDERRFYSGLVGATGCTVVGEAEERMFWP
ncbi:xylose isomerase-like protein [Sarocladium strictum]